LIDAGASCGADDCDLHGLAPVPRSAPILPDLDDDDDDDDETGM
jgi:hypothetical protein